MLMEGIMSGGTSLRRKISCDCSIRKDVMGSLLVVLLRFIDSSFATQSMFRLFSNVPYH